MLVCVQFVVHVHCVLHAAIFAAKCSIVSANEERGADNGMVARIASAQLAENIYIGPHGVVWYRYYGGDIWWEPGTWLGWHWEGDEASYEIWYTYGSRVSDLDPPAW